MQAEADTIQLMGFYTYKTMETPGTGHYMNSTTPKNAVCFQSFVTEQYNPPQLQESGAVCKAPFHLKFDMQYLE
jgi:hypothetical protein